MDTTELLGGPTVDCNVDSIRCICYGGGVDGDKYLVTGDDAKRVKVWSTDTLRCILKPCNNLKFTRISFMFPVSPKCFL